MSVHLQNKKDARIFDRRWRLENLYLIRKEDRTLGKLVMNEVQEVLFQHAEKTNFRGIRDIDPKARKLGISTFWFLFYLDDTLWTPNTTSAIVAHRREDVQKLFNIVKLAYNSCPDEIELSDGRVWQKPKANYDSVNELRFEDINSTIYVALESRGETNNNLHISEAAYIKDDGRIKATLASVPNITFGSNITVESTANGVGGWFHETCVAAQQLLSNFHLHFFPWFIVKKHAIPAPEWWQPGKDVMRIQKRVLEHYSVELSRDQMYWWEKTRQDQGRLMDQEFPTLLDDAFLVTGNLAFDVDAINAITPKEPIRTWNGVSIWVEPKPKRRYVIAADPAEGVGGDRSTIEVVDALTLEQVAEFISDEIKPPELAILVDKVARLYNMGIAVPERNNHGHTVLDRLKDLYSNIYQRYVFDEKANKRTRKLGWETNVRTRDLILDDMDQLMRDKTVRFNSATLKSELLTFVVNEDGKREAKSGKHDDTIMAMAIALKVARLPRSSFIISTLG